MAHAAAITSATRMAALVAATIHISIHLPIPEPPPSSWPPGPRFTIGAIFVKASASAAASVHQIVSRVRRSSLAFAKASARMSSMRGCERVSMVG